MRPSRDPARERAADERYALKHELAALKAQRDQALEEQGRLRYRLDRAERARDEARALLLLALMGAVTLGETPPVPLVVPSPTLPDLRALADAVAAIRRAITLREPDWVAVNGALHAAAPIIRRWANEPDEDERA